MKVSKLYLQEGVSRYRLLRWKSMDVAVLGYFFVNGFRFLVIRDPFVKGRFTVIEEKSGLRIYREFYARSVGAAYDTAVDIIRENIERLPFRVEIMTGLPRQSFSMRSNTPTVNFLLT